MNEIETTLESAPAPRSTIRRSVVRRRFERLENEDAMPLLLTVDAGTKQVHESRRCAASNRRLRIPLSSRSQAGDDRVGNLPRNPVGCADEKVVPRARMGKAARKR